MDIQFEKLAEAVRDAGQAQVAKSRLVVCHPVTPFVPPPLIAPDSGSADPFAAEVVFVQAPAAVGKSTVARHLSASRHTPLLDLATIPVATGSLKSLVSDLGPDAVARFHSAQLPVIIDALDEGRMLSGEKGFEAFLVTSGEFLLSNRSESHKPKLIVLGRPESVDLTRAGLEMSGGGINMSLVRVGFFDEHSAFDMINAHAKKVASQSAAYRKHPESVKALIAAYFRAIEAALGLRPGQLWVDEMGRAFAGYAPVLSALGLLLADADNFKEIENKLTSEGMTEAWGVIEKVLDAILLRERGKLCDKLGTKISVPVPPEAYDAHEQLTYITQHVHRLPLQGTSRVRLPAKDVPAYDSLVAGYLHEHPFVRERRLENAVLGSVVLGHAVVQDLLHDTDLGQLAALSNQPFLWRAVRKQLSNGDALIDGRYLGYLLSSFWTEPVQEDEKIVIRSVEPGMARVFVSRRGRESALSNVTLPITFFRVMKDCDVDVDGGIELQGQSRGSQSVFEVHRSALLSAELQVNVDLLLVNGNVWIEAKSAVCSPKLELSLKDGAQVGWGGVLLTQHPWKKYAATLPPRARPAGTDTLTVLLTECGRRAIPSALTFKSDWTLTDDDRMRWAVREFPTELPLLVKLMVEHGLATSEKIPVNQVQVHLKASWGEMLAALAAQEPPQNLKAFVTATRSKIR